ncbi:MAG TPA: S53 family peptidase [Streptosporangiaceae bacterium]|nr:S53 family peptidase [Streptosporangiaceae bacterium]
MKSFTWLSPRRTVAVLATGAAGSLLIAAALPATGATQSNRPARIAVPQGIGTGVLTTLKSSGVFTPGSTPETVSFILKARNVGFLKASVETGMPGGYLSVSEFASLYGQSKDNISALVNYLAGFGISSTVLADRLDVTATGTADQFNSALSVQQQSFSVPAVRAHDGLPGRPAMTIHGTRQTPLLPAGIGRFVLSILGLSNYPTFNSLAVHTPALKTGLKPSGVQTGSLTPMDFAKQYNLSPLYAKGALGQGTTVGIVTLASLDPTDPVDFWTNVLGLRTLPDRISLVNVDGGAGPVSANAGSGETALDVEQSGALAPDANIVVYQAPNTDFGFVDAFFTAASQNTADSVSASWGESETAIQGAVNSGVESPTYAISFDEADLELAAQGQSTFLSAGDFGAYTAAEDVGTTNLAAGNPDSSPWVTSAGGTTLPGTIPLTSTDSASISTERTWGWDWLWPHFADFGFPSQADMAFSNPIGGGGGFSVYERTPFYQQLVPSAHHFSAVEYLTPTNFMTVQGMNLPTAWDFNPSPSVITGWGNGRATPDVSADADPFTGYLLDFQGSVQGGWGGTSFVAPQLNGSTAVIDSMLGHRVGLWNPAIYRFAVGHRSPFTPLDTPSADNDNLFYTGTRGQIFNVGSGLGTPDLARLAADFARR